MSIVPVRHLTPSDLSALGNNVRPPQRRRQRLRRRRRRLIDTINRSLATVGEAIQKLDRSPVGLLA